MSEQNLRGSSTSPARTPAPQNSVTATEPPRAVSEHLSTITFIRPTLTLPVSLTGAQCALSCAHCAGRYLQHMTPIDQCDHPDCTSLLVSGGCDEQGRVPVGGDHLARLRVLHQSYRLNWHVGLADQHALERLDGLLDVISFDIVGDSAAVREVYGLDVSLDQYMDTLHLLQEYARVVPHITIGLRGGLPSGEIAAIQRLAQEQIAALVLIILIPTPGTAYADRQPPSLEHVAQVMRSARELLPSSRITLGCMRPHGAYRQAVDELALRAGLDGIVNPTHAVQKLALSLGHTIRWEQECCAFQL